MGKRRHDFQLVDDSTGAALSGPHGSCWAIAAGTQTWLETFDPSNDMASNGRAAVDLVNGMARFAVDDDVLTVDLFGIAPTGHSWQALGIAAGFAQVRIDTNRLFGQSLVVPFDAGDTDKWTVNTETDSGIDLPYNVATARAGSVRVLERDAGETITMGLLSSEPGGDADGFLTAVSVATLGVAVDDAAPTLTKTPNAGAKSVTVTLSAGSDTGRGYAVLSYDIIGAVGW